MKNNVDIARFNHDFEEFLHEVKSDFFDFKENLKREHEQDLQVGCQCHSVPLSHSIQEDLIALLEEREVDDETGDTGFSTLVNHFQDQIEEEILSLEKQLHTLKKLEESYYEL